MTTTGQLRAIIEELELVDVGDAASYLGEEAIEVEQTSFSTMAMFTCTDHIDYVVTDKLSSYQLH